MRPPIWRGRPEHPDDLDETKELHQAEIAMGLDEDPKGNSMVKTHLYDVSSTVHQGRLGAAVHTLRLVSSSVRRLIGRMSMSENRVELAHDRIAVLEWTAVILLGLTGMVLWGTAAGWVAFVVCRIWFWLAP